jgi:hypothetical protein
MLCRFLVAALTAFAVTTASITDCGSTAARFQMTRLELFPDPPSPGEEVFMAVEFENPGQVVESGSAKRSLTLNGLPVVDETVALCPDATACPLLSGFNNRSAISTWPDVTGKVVSTIRWYDETAAELLCIKTSVTVSPSSSSSASYRLRGSRPQTHTHIHTHPHPHTALGGIWSSVSTSPPPSNAIALLYPLPEFRNSTICSIHQYHDLYE